MMGTNYFIIFLILLNTLFSDSQVIANSDSTSEAAKTIQHYYRAFKSKTSGSHPKKLNSTEVQLVHPTRTSITPTISESSTGIKPSEDGEIKGLLSEEVVQSIVTVSHIIQSICPPKDCLIVGIGRSPTPFAAYWQLKSEGYFWNIPLSNFRNGLEEGVESKKDLINVLFDHFQKYLPLESEMNNRSVVVLDFSMSGRSLVHATFYMREYFRIKAIRSGTIKALAILGPDSFYDSGFHPDIDQAILFEDYQNKLFQNLRGQKFDKFAEFGVLNFAKIDKTVSLLEPKRQSGLGYQKLKSEFQKIEKTFIPDATKYSLIKVEQISPFTDQIFSNKTDKARRILAGKQVQYLNPGDQEKFLRLGLQDSDEEVRCAVISTLRKYKGTELKEIFSTFIPSTDHPATLICFYAILDEIKKKKPYQARTYQIDQWQNLIQEKKPQGLIDYFAIPDDQKFDVVFNIKHKKKVSHAIRNLEDKIFTKENYQTKAGSELSHDGENSFQFNLNPSSSGPSHPLKALAK